MRSFIVVILSFLISTNIFASDIGTVFMVRGKATVLLPKDLKAKMIKKGMKLKKDSSVFVNERSFVRIKFIDGSYLNIGPKSKIILDMDINSKTSIISLLTGKIRATVKRKKNGKPRDKKFLVRTKTAAMGVRGTDFQVTYNDDGTRTSLLTYEGRVDIKKLPRDKAENLNKLTSLKKTKKIKMLLNDGYEAVKMGDFTNVNSESIRPIKPVKINPAQFVLLERDQSMGVDKLKLSKKVKAKLKRRVSKLKKKFAKDINRRKQQRKVKDLGVVDSGSGFYVPPSDELNKLIGELDSNGGYIPPKGTKIDPNRGLVAKANASKEVKEIVKRVQYDSLEQVSPKEAIQDGLSREEFYKKYFNEN